VHVWLTAHGMAMEKQIEEIIETNRMLIRILPERGIDAGPGGSSMTEMASSAAALEKLLEHGKRQQEQILIAFEQAGFIDEPEPQNRLRLETREDRLLVLELLYAVRRQKIDVRMWARAHPVEFARIWEIFPKKDSGRR
jgi:hypothetical protein